MSDKQQIRAWLVAAIKSFDDDPPDTDTQQGYLEALEVVLHEAVDGGAMPPKSPRPKLMVIEGGLTP